MGGARTGARTRASAPVPPRWGGLHAHAPTRAKRSSAVGPTSAPRVPPPLRSRSCRCPGPRPCCCRCCLHGARCLAAPRPASPLPRRKRLKHLAQCRPQPRASTWPTSQGRRGAGKGAARQETQPQARRGRRGACCTCRASRTGRPAALGRTARCVRGCGRVGVEQGCGPACTLPVAPPASLCHGMPLPPPSTHVRALPPPPQANVDHSLIHVAGATPHASFPPSTHTRASPPPPQANAYRGLIHVAGAIPLVPMTMAVVAGGGGQQALLALANAQAVAVAVGGCVARGALGLVVYVASGAAPEAKVRAALGAWVALHACRGLPPPLLLALLMQGHCQGTVLAPCMADPDLSLCVTHYYHHPACRPPSRPPCPGCWRRASRP